MVTTCILGMTICNRRFGRTCCLHLPSQKTVILQHMCLIQVTIHRPAAVHYFDYFMELQQETLNTKFRSECVNLQHDLLGDMHSREASDDHAIVTPFPVLSRHTARIIPHTTVD
jgi:hypothetical protein